MQQIHASNLSFAAIRTDGSVITWGSSHDGGNSSAVQDQLKNVQQIQATNFAFAAIRMRLFGLMARSSHGVLPMMVAIARLSRTS